MKRTILLLTVITLTIAACKSGEKNTKSNRETLFTIGDEAIAAGEFKRMFEKNNSKGDTQSKQEVDKYLDLYVKFKLKVKEARELGLDTQKSYIMEMQGYKHQLAQPYLTDTAVTEDLIKEAYNRLNYEVKASHILIRCSPQAAPKDTLEAYNRMLKIREQYINGASFDSLAAATSEDPSAVKNKGDLGYFTAFNMIYEFESAAYNTPVGEVSMPFRTTFGYHIVMVEEKRPARGEVKVAHIMIQVPKNATTEDWVAAEEKIRAIKDRTLQNETFEDLAKNYSDDFSTKKAGGEIGWLKSLNGRFPAQFVDACYTLKENGEISEPVKTDYGWHLIKRLDYKAPPTLADEEYYIKNSISKDSRSSKGQEAMVVRIKEEKNFKENKKAYKAMENLFDTTLLEGKWRKDKETDSVLLTKTLFTLGTKSTLKEYSINDFMRFVASFQSPDLKASVSQKVRTMYNDFVKNEVLMYKEEYLREDDASFDYILTEYEEGILLFEFMQNEVWNKAVTDTTARLAYYEANKENYKWKQRTEAVIYKCQTKEIAAKVEKMLSEGATDSAVIVNLNKENVLAVQLDYGVFEEGTNEYIDKTEKTKGVHNLGFSNGVYTVVNVNKVMAPDYKKPEEAQGQLISDFQESLEANYLEELRKKYPVVIDQEVLNNLFIYKD